MQHTSKKAKSQTTIEFRRQPTSGPIGLARQENTAEYTSIVVSPDFANACRALARRGRHGVYSKEIGGVDVLGEFALHGIPVVTKPLEGHDHRSSKFWIITRADFRFPEDAD